MWGLEFGVAVLLQVVPHNHASGVLFSGNKLACAQCSNIGSPHIKFDLCSSSQKLFIWKTSSLLSHAGRRSTGDMRQAVVSCSGEGKWATVWVGGLGRRRGGGGRHARHVGRGREANRAGVGTRQQSLLHSSSLPNSGRGNQGQPPPEMLNMGRKKG